MTAQIIDFEQFMDRPPTPQQKALWDRFVQEYLKDFKPIDAALRCGFNITFAQEYSMQFMRQPYVQRQIMERKMQPSEDKNEVEVAKALIIATLVECMSSGMPATRVAAAKTLAGIHGLDQSPDRSSEDLEKLVEGFKSVAKALPD